MSNVTVIDGKGHMLGRLASITAKQLLAGKKIAIVRAEQILISGSRTLPPICSFEAHNLFIANIACGVGFSLLCSYEKQGEVCPVHQEENQHQPQAWSYSLPLPCQNLLENCKCLSAEHVFANCTC